MNSNRRKSLARLWSRLWCRGGGRPAPPVCAVAMIAGTLAACSGAAIGTASLPSQSGTLANAASPASVSAKPFNPFADASEERTPRRVVIDKPTMAEVMQGGPLPERSLGRTDAPVTVIKYASMTCPYCRQFNRKTFPQLKKKYIDTGKVRFILREFPIGFQSGAATIALRCVPSKRYFEAYDALMRAQPRWVSQDVRREPIWQVVKRFGLTRAKFDACFDDKKLVADLNAVKERGRTLGVIGTPNFFINNKLYKSVLTISDFDRVLTAGGVASAAR